MPSLAYRLRLKVWAYSGHAAWYFVTLPKREAREIKGLLGEAARGWGSLRVVATVGDTTWKTSIFPDKASRSYVLPIKASVRKAEHIEADKVIAIQVHVSD